MSIRAMCAAAILIASAVIQPAQADTWTMSTTGRILNGVDWAGIFAPVGTDLFYMPFTQTITASIDPAAWTGFSNNEYQGIGPSFTTTVTINGVTKTFTTESTIFGYQSLWQTPEQDHAHSINEGYTSSGARVYSSIGITSNSAFSFMESASYGQTAEVDLRDNDKDFATMGSSYFLYREDPSQPFIFLQSISQKYAINMIATGGPTTPYNPQPVPEPETYAMLLTGLGIVGAMARRRRALYPHNKQSPSGLLKVDVVSTQY